MELPSKNADKNADENAEAVEPANVLEEPWNDDWQDEAFLQPCVPDPNAPLLDDDNLEVSTLPCSDNSGSKDEVLTVMGTRLLVAIAKIFDDNDEHLVAARINLSLAWQLADNNCFNEALSLQLKTASKLTRAVCLCSAEWVAVAAAAAMETFQQPGHF